MVAETIVPAPVVRIFPDVDRVSPAVVGVRVVVPLFLVKKPTVPEVSVVVIVPEHTRLPVASSTVHPVEPDPPAKETSPSDAIRSACAPEVVLYIVNCDVSAFREKSDSPTSLSTKNTDGSELAIVISPPAVVVPVR